MGRGRVGQFGDAKEVEEDCLEDRLLDSDLFDLALIRLLDAFLKVLLAEVAEMAANSMVVIVETSSS